jgi:gliding motility-associated-like protein
VKLFLTFFVLVITLGTSAQENLILNGELDGGSNANFFGMENWERFEGTPDAYTPANNWGSETTTNNSTPHSGTGFIGFYQYGYWGGQMDWYEREYIMAETNYPLEAGKVYQMEYWVKPVSVDIVGISYAIDQIGALFTAEVPIHDEQNIFPQVPQVDNGGTILNDLSQWTQVSGCFVAEGGERYVTMGNFQRDEETTTLPLPGAMQPSLAYYLLDAVSLVEVEFPSLSSDTTLCNGDSYVIQLNHPSAQYLWSDGSTGSSYTVDHAGTHFVDITINGCTHRDEVLVEEHPSPSATSHEAEFCFGERIVLGVSDDFELLWSTGETSETILVEDEGIYWVQLSNICGTATEEFHLEGKDCSCQVWVPNSFTPNNDGVNDRFTAEVDCELLDFQLSVYNRWGELVFSTTDPQEGWNGGGESPYYVQDGIYQWVMEYRSSAVDVQDVRNVGTVTVIR